MMLGFGHQITNTFATFGYQKYISINTNFFLLFGMEPTLKMIGYLEVSNANINVTTPTELELPPGQLIDFSTSWMGANILVL